MVKGDHLSRLDRSSRYCLVWYLGLLMDADGRGRSAHNTKAYRHMHVWWAAQPSLHEYFNCINNYCIIQAVHLYLTNSDPLENSRIGKVCITSLLLLELHITALTETAFNLGSHQL